MLVPKVITASEAVALIENNKTLCTVGMTLVAVPEFLLKEIEKQFLETGNPSNLTLVHSCGQSDRVRGIAHLAHEGLLKRIIGGHWGLCPPLMKLIDDNHVEAYNLPQGQMANMYHSMALREPGKISKVGLGTFIDPRIEGGKMNERTKKLEDIVKVIEIDGEEYLQYMPIPIDYLIMRGTYCDENGNFSTVNEAMNLEVLPAVMATKRYGGKVICQVERIVKNGTINPKEVIVPGVFIDYVVKCENPFEDHRQTSAWYYDPSYSGQAVAATSDDDGIPLNVRKIIGRRAMMFLEPYSIVNVGTGIPNDTVGPIIIEEDISDYIMITVESGVYGGKPAGGVDFGISQNPQALLSHDRQFEYYNGKGIDFTFMGAGEIDSKCNINATKMGPSATGAGGFIDITATAQNVIFCSTFTSGGLEVSISPKEGLRIIKEGKYDKFVSEVQQISYNFEEISKTGQKAFFVTERAVFELTTDGPVLIEIAKGIDLEKDIINKMGFKPIIADDLQITSLKLYEEEPFGLRKLIESKL